MSKNAKVITQNLNHLGLIAGTIKELGIPERIDEILGEKVQATKHVSVGECVSAMIINGLGLVNRAMYLVSSFFQNKPVGRLINPHVKAEFLNDDAMGNSLDIIADFDPTSFFANIAFPIGMNRKYRRRFARLDNTNFSLEGAYEGFGDSPEDAPQMLKINYGHSKKHRPDLKQVTLSMMNSGAAGFPFWAEPLNGNASDKKTFHETIRKVQEFQKQIGDTEPFNWVADSALYSKNHLLKEVTSFLWITRVPETINEAKEIVRRPDSSFEWEELEGGYKVCALESKYGGIVQRWVLVSSQQAYKREVETLNKRIDKSRKTLKTALWHLSKDEFACEADARKRFDEVVKKYSFHTATFAAKTVEKFNKRGRPLPDAKPQKIIVQVVESDITENAEAVSKARMSKGRFILATNDLDTKRLPNSDVLREYKDLQKVERGFRFLKDPWFMLDKLFLKTPKRIAALMAVMSLCLMVYAVSEYELRETLRKSNNTLPNQLNKEIANPTIRWVFSLMDGIAVATIDPGGGPVETIVANITKLSEKIIRLFGRTTEQIYDLSPT